MTGWQNSERMRRAVFAIAGAATGYLLGAFGGGYLVNALSSNTHDVSVEAAMTGAFVLGPAAALIGAVVGIWRGRSRGTAT